MKQVLASTLSLVLASSAFAAPAPPQNSTGTTKTKKSSSSTTISKQLQDVQKALADQQQQIQALKDQVQSRDTQIQQLQQQVGQSQAVAAQAQQKADAAAPQSQVAQQQADLTAVKSDVTDLKGNVTNTALALQESQKDIQKLGSPLAIHYKGITITPGGFLAAETVWRSRALGADINTPFNAIPQPGANQSNLSEFFGSGRQSRISLLAEGKTGETKMTGYFEGDFLSAGVTSNNNQSNSYTFRQRQVWGQAALQNGWSFTGGQMWSLVTETKKGVDNRSEALPMTIDPQYTVGFSWARQYGFRVAKNFNNKAWLALSVEDSQATISQHNAFPNFLVGNTGNGGGLYNSLALYSFNPTPDFILKGAFEPGFGHYEVFGILSDFRDRVFPGATNTTPTADGAHNTSTLGGGIGGNARMSFAQKKIDFGLHFLGGNGVGRYGTSGLPDATVNPSGSLALIRSYQGLGTLEFHAKKFDLYFNGGAEYAGRNYTLDSAVKGGYIGYGSPIASNVGCGVEPVPNASPTSPNVLGFNPGSLSSCAFDTRALVEGSFGFWYRIYNGEKGRLQVGPQYSYVTRNTWSGVGGPNAPSDPHGTENMVFTSFRYYLP